MPYTVRARSCPPVHRCCVRQPGDTVPRDLNGTSGLQRAAMVGSSDGRFLVMWGGRNQGGRGQQKRRVVPEQGVYDTSLCCQQGHVGLDCSVWFLIIQYGRQSWRRNIKRVGWPVMKQASLSATRRFLGERAPCFHWLLLAVRPSQPTWPRTACGCTTRMEVRQTAGRGTALQ